MTTQIETYILSLSREYLATCDLLTSHHYHSEDERRALSRQRTFCHDELVRVLGDAYARPFDMQGHCRRLLSE